MSIKVSESCMVVPPYYIRLCHAGRFKKNPEKHLFLEKEKRAGVFFLPKTV
jgi:hypothetical protein